MKEPDALEILLDEARKYAEFSMRNVGNVPPTMLAMTPEGLLKFIPDRFDDEKAKTKFLNTARLICGGYGATTVVMILESWMRLSPSGEELDDTPPCEALDRKEFVILMGESTGKKTQVLLPILRSDAGGFFGFGDFDSSGFQDFRGPFGVILASIPADQKSMEMALLLLQAMGVTKSLLQSKHGKN